MELLHGNCIVVNQLASSIVSQLFQCIQVFFFWFFCFCFFLVSYTPNFKIFTRITFTYEFLPISFLSCLNAYFYAFFFSFFQRFLPSSHGVTGVPPLVWHFTLMVCKIFDSAVVVNTNTNLVMSWVVEMVIFSLLLLRELHPVTGKLSIVNVYMHTLSLALTLSIIISNGNGTEWCSIQSVVALVINNWTTAKRESDLIYRFSQA